MDINNAYAQGGISASLIFGGGILYRIYRSVNGKRVRCGCCGYNLEADFKVDEMPPTPPKENFVIQNPLPLQQPSCSQ
jgi:hypothetical protein